MTARDIHSQAEQARENGDFIKALELSDQATIAYHKENDVLGVAEIQASRSITLRLISEEKDDKNFLILAKHAAQAGLEIAQSSGNQSALALPYLNVAKIQEALGENNEALENFKQAVENITKNPPDSNNRPGVVADFKIHLAVSEYKNGDRSALDRALAAIADLKASDEDSYNKNVWLSGGFMHLAEVLKTDDSSKTKEYLQEAKKIIDSDERLKIRLQQWEKLAQKLQ